MSSPEPGPDPKTGDDSTPALDNWQKGPLLLAAAMPLEAGLITPLLEPDASIGKRPVWQGRLSGCRVLLLLTGMGVVNAAQAITAALETRPGIKGIVNLGCAGAYAGAGLEIGRAMLCSHAVFADSGVRTVGRMHGLDKIKIPLLHDTVGNPLYNQMPLHEDLRHSLALANPGIVQGGVATVNQVSGDAASAAELEQRWGCLLEDMETAAVAQVATWYGLPCAAIRGVSNQAGMRKLDVAAGANAAQTAFLNWTQKK
jgi:futalosine hydrolase